VPDLHDAGEEQRGQEGVQGSTRESGDEHAPCAASSRSAHTPPNSTQDDERHEPRASTNPTSAADPVRSVTAQRQDDERQPVADLADQLRREQQAERAVSQDGAHGAVF
jgi:hypothetical protein